MHRLSTLESELGGDELLHVGTAIHAKHERAERRQCNVEIDGGAAARLVGHPFRQLGCGNMSAIDRELVTLSEVLARRVLEQAPGHGLVTRALLLRESVHVAREDALRFLSCGSSRGDAE